MKISEVKELIMFMKENGVIELKVLDTAIKLDAFLLTSKKEQHDKAPGFTTHQQRHQPEIDEAEELWSV